MKLPAILVKGKLIKRYKRFLADVELENGAVVTAFCPNTGSMKSCSDPGNEVRLSISDNPKRKLKYTWELVKSNDVWVGINTGRPNKLVQEAIETGVAAELQGYRSIRSEVKYGQSSRIDLLLENEKNRCYVEVKNVTLVQGSRALFPDAVTLRGQKHLKELMRMVRDGHRAIMFYVVQREDGKTFAPADEIDPAYGTLLRQAVKAGVEIIAYQAKVSEREIYLTHGLPVCLNEPSEQQKSEGGKK